MAGEKLSSQIVTSEVQKLQGPEKLKQERNEFLAVAAKSGVELDNADALLMSDKAKDFLHGQIPTINGELAKVAAEGKKIQDKHENKQDIEASDYEPLAQPKKNLIAELNEIKSESEIFRQLEASEKKVASFVDENKNINETTNLNNIPQSLQRKALLFKQLTELESTIPDKKTGVTIDYQNRIKNQLKSLQDQIQKEVLDGQAVKNLAIKNAGQKTTLDDYQRRLQSLKTAKEPNREKIDQLTTLVESAQIEHLDLESQQNVLYDQMGASPFAGKALNEVQTTLLDVQKSQLEQLMSGLREMDVQAENLLVEGQNIDPEKLAAEKAAKEKAEGELSAIKDGLDKLLSQQKVEANTKDIYLSGTQYEAFDAKIATQKAAFEAARSKFGYEEKMTAAEPLMRVTWKPLYDGPHRAIESAIGELESNQNERKKAVDALQKERFQKELPFIIGKFQHNWETQVEGNGIVDATGEKLKPLDNFDANSKEYKDYLANENQLLSSLVRIESELDLLLSKEDYLDAYGSTELNRYKRKCPIYLRQIQNNRTFRNLRVAAEAEQEQIEKYQQITGYKEEKTGNIFSSTRTVPEFNAGKEFSVQQFKLTDYLEIVNPNDPDYNIINGGKGWRFTKDPDVSGMQEAYNKLPLNIKAKVPKPPTVEDIKRRLAVQADRLVDTVKKESNAQFNSEKHKIIQKGNLYDKAKELLKDEAPDYFAAVEAQVNGEREKAIKLFNQYIEKVNNLPESERGAHNDLLAQAKQQVEILGNTQDFYAALNLIKDGNKTEAISKLRNFITTMSSNPKSMLYGEQLAIAQDQIRGYNTLRLTEFEEIYADLQMLKIREIQDSMGPSRSKEKNTRGTRKELLEKGINGPEMERIQSFYQNLKKRVDSGEIIDFDKEYEVFKKQQQAYLKTLESPISGDEKVKDTVSSRLLSVYELIRNGDPKAKEEGYTQMAELFYENKGGEAYTQKYLDKALKHTYEEQRKTETGKRIMEDEKRALLSDTKAMDVIEKRALEMYKRFAKENGLPLDGPPNQLVYQSYVNQCFNSIYTARVNREIRQHLRARDIRYENAYGVKADRALELYDKSLPYNVEEARWYNPKTWEYYSEDQWEDFKDQATEFVVSAIATIPIGMGAGAVGRMVGTAGLKLLAKAGINEVVISVIEQGGIRALTQNPQLMAVLSNTAKSQIYTIVGGSAVAGLVAEGAVMMAGNTLWEGLSTEHVNWLENTKDSKTVAFIQELTKSIALAGVYRVVGKGQEKVMAMGASDDLAGRLFTWGIGETFSGVAGAGVGALEMYHNGQSAELTMNYWIRSIAENYLQSTGTHIGHRPPSGTGRAHRSDRRMAEAGNTVDRMRNFVSDEMHITKPENIASAEVKSDGRLIINGETMPRDLHMDHLPQPLQNRIIELSNSEKHQRALSSRLFNSSIETDISNIPPNMRDKPAYIDKDGSIHYNAEIAFKNAGAKVISGDDGVVYFTFDDSNQPYRSSGEKKNIRELLKLLQKDPDGLTATERKWLIVAQNVRNKIVALKKHEVTHRIVEHANQQSKGQLANQLGKIINSRPALKEAFLKRCNEEGLNPNDFNSIQEFLSDIADGSIKDLPLQDIYKIESTISTHGNIENFAFEKVRYIDTRLLAANNFDRHMFTRTAAAASSHGVRHEGSTKNVDSVDNLTNTRRELNTTAEPKVENSPNKHLQEEFQTVIEALNSDYDLSQDQNYQRLQTTQEKTQYLYKKINEIEQVALINRLPEEIISSLHTIVEQMVESKVRYKGETYIVQNSSKDSNSLPGNWKENIINDSPNQVFVEGKSVVLTLNDNHGNQKFIVLNGLEVNAPMVLIGLPGYNNLREHYKQTNDIIRKEKGLIAEEIRTKRNIKTRNLGTESTRKSGSETKDQESSKEPQPKQTQSNKPETPEQRPENAARDKKQLDAAIERLNLNVKALDSDYNLDNDINYQKLSSDKERAEYINTKVIQIREKRIMNQMPESVTTDLMALSKSLVGESIGILTIEGRITKLAELPSDWQNNQTNKSVFVEGKSVVLVGRDYSGKVGYLVLNGTEQEHRIPRVKNPDINKRLEQFYNRHEESIKTIQAQQEAVRRQTATQIGVEQANSLPQRKISNEYISRLRSRAREIRRNPGEIVNSQGVSVDINSLPKEEKSRAIRQKIREESEKIRLEIEKKQEFMGKISNELLSELNINPDLKAQDIVNIITERQKEAKIEFSQEEAKAIVTAVNRIMERRQNILAIVKQYGNDAKSLFQAAFGFEPRGNVEIVTTNLGLNFIVSDADFKPLYMKASASDAAENLAGFNGIKTNLSAIDGAINVIKKGLSRDINDVIGHEDRHAMNKILSPLDMRLAYMSIAASQATSISGVQNSCSQYLQFTLRRAQDEISAYLTHETPKQLLLESLNTHYDYWSDFRKNINNKNLPPEIIDQILNKYREKHNRMVRDMVEGAYRHRNPFQAILLSPINLARTGRISNIEYNQPQSSGRELINSRFVVNKDNIPAEMKNKPAYIDVDGSINYAPDAFNNLSVFPEINNGILSFGINVRTPTGVKSYHLNSKEFFRIRAKARAGKQLNSTERLLLPIVEKVRSRMIKLRSHEVSHRIVEHINQQTNGQLARDLQKAINSNEVLRKRYERICERKGRKPEDFNSMQEFLSEIAEGTIRVTNQQRSILEGAISRQGIVDNFDFSRVRNIDTRLLAANNFDRSMFTRAEAAASSLGTTRENTHRDATPPPPMSDPSTEIFIPTDPRVPNTDPTLVAERDSVVTPSETSDTSREVFYGDSNEPYGDTHVSSRHSLEIDPGTPVSGDGPTIIQPAGEVGLGRDSRPTTSSPDNTLISHGNESHSTTSERNTIPMEPSIEIDLSRPSSRPPEPLKRDLNNTLPSANRSGIEVPTHRNTEISVEASTKTVTEAGPETARSKSENDVDIPIVFADEHESIRNPEQLSNFHESEALHHPQIDALSAVNKPAAHSVPPVAPHLPMMPTAAPPRPRVNVENFSPEKKNLYERHKNRISNLDRKLQDMPTEVVQLLNEYPALSKNQVNKLIEGEYYLFKKPESNQVEVVIGDGLIGTGGLGSVREAVMLTISADGKVSSRNVAVKQVVVDRREANATNHRINAEAELNSNQALLRFERNNGLLEPIHRGRFEEGGVETFFLINDVIRESSASRGVKEVERIVQSNIIEPALKLDMLEDISLMLENKAENGVVSLDDKLSQYVFGEGPAGTKVYGIDHTFITYEQLMKLTLMDVSSNRQFQRIKDFRGNLLTEVYLPFLPNKDASEAVTVGHFQPFVAHLREAKRQAIEAGPNPDPQTRNRIMEIPQKGILAHMMDQQIYYLSKQVPADSKSGQALIENLKKVQQRLANPTDTITLAEVRETINNIKRNYESLKDTGIGGLHVVNKERVEQLINEGKLSGDAARIEGYIDGDGININVDHWNSAYTKDPNTQQRTKLIAEGYTMVANTSGYGMGEAVIIVDAHGKKYTIAEYANIVEGYPLDDLQRSPLIQKRDQFIRHEMHHRVLDFYKNQKITIDNKPSTFGRELINIATKLLDSVPVSSQSAIHKKYKKPLSFRQAEELVADIQSSPQKYKDVPMSSRNELNIDLLIIFDNVGVTNYSATDIIKIDANLLAQNPPEAFSRAGDINPHSISPTPLSQSSNEMGHFISSREGPYYKTYQTYRDVPRFKLSPQTRRVLDAFTQVNHIQNLLRENSRVDIRKTSTESIKARESIGTRKVNMIEIQYRKLLLNGDYAKATQYKNKSIAEFGEASGIRSVFDVISVKLEPSLNTRLGLITTVESRYNQFRLGKDPVETVYYMQQVANSSKNKDYSSFRNKTILTTEAGIFRVNADGTLEFHSMYKVTDAQRAKFARAELDRVMEGFNPDQAIANSRTARPTTLDVGIMGNSPTIEVSRRSPGEEPTVQVSREMFNEVPVQAEVPQPRKRPPVKAADIELLQVVIGNVDDAPTSTADYQQIGKEFRNSQKSSQDQALVDHIATALENGVINHISVAKHVYEILNNRKLSAEQIDAFIKNVQTATPRELLNIANNKLHPEAIAMLASDAVIALSPEHLAALLDPATSEHLVNILSKERSIDLSEDHLAAILDPNTPPRIAEILGKDTQTLIDSSAITLISNPAFVDMHPKRVVLLEGIIENSLVDKNLIDTIVNSDGEVIKTNLGPQEVSVSHTRFAEGGLAEIYKAAILVPGSNPPKVEIIGCKKVKPEQKENGRKLNQEIKAMEIIADLKAHGIDMDMAMKYEFYSEDQEQVFMKLEQYDGQSGDLEKLFSRGEIGGDLVFASHEKAADFLSKLADAGYIWPDFKMNNLVLGTGRDGKPKAIAIDLEGLMKIDDFINEESTLYITPPDAPPNDYHTNPQAKAKYDLYLQNYPDKPTDYFGVGPNTVGVTPTYYSSEIYHRMIKARQSGDMPAAREQAKMLMRFAWGRQLEQYLTGQQTIVRAISTPNEIQKNPFMPLTEVSYDTYHDENNNLIDPPIKTANLTPQQRIKLFELQKRAINPDDPLTMTEAHKEFSRILNSEQASLPRDATRLSEAHSNDQPNHVSSRTTAENKAHTRMDAEAAAAVQNSSREADFQPHLVEPSVEHTPQEKQFLADCETKFKEGVEDFLLWKDQIEDSHLFIIADQFQAGRRAEVIKNIQKALENLNNISEANTLTENYNRNDNPKIPGSEWQIVKVFSQDKAAVFLSPDGKLHLLRGAQDRYNYPLFSRRIADRLKQWKKLEGPAKVSAIARECETLATMMEHRKYSAEARKAILSQADADLLPIISDPTPQSIAKLTSEQVNRLENTMLKLENQVFRNDRDQAFAKAKAVVEVSENIELNMRQAIENNPKITRGELYRILDLENNPSFKRANLDSNDMVRLEFIVDSLFEKAKTIQSYQSRFKDNPKQLFEEVFGFAPEGEVALGSTTFSIYFICKNSRDFATITGGSHAGEALPFGRSGIESLDGVIVVINNDKIGNRGLDYIVQHEEQHNINKYTFRAMQPEYHGWAELKYDSHSPLETQYRSVRTYMEDLLNSRLILAKDEILAYMKNGDTPDQIFAKLVHNKGNGYDFWHKTDQELWRTLTEREAPEEVKKYLAFTLTNEMRQRYREQLINAISAAERINDINLLMNYNIEQWNSVASINYPKPPQRQTLVPS